MIIPSIPQSITLFLVKHKRKHKNRGRQVNDARLGLCVVKLFISTNLTQKIVTGTFKLHVFLSSNTKLSMLRKCPNFVSMKLQQNLSAKKTDSEFALKTAVQISSDGTSFSPSSCRSKWWAECCPYYSRYLRVYFLQCAGHENICC